MWLGSFIWSIVGPSCSREPLPSPEIVSGAPAAMVRIPADEWRNSVEDLLGVRWGGALPVEYRLEDYARIGGATLGVPQLDLELYEAATWSVATTALRDQGDVDEMLGCSSGEPACVRSFVARFGRRAWRRPLSSSELDAMVSLHDSVATAQGDVLAAIAVCAAILLSPEFLFRVELGEPSETGRVLSSYEMAGRLASFLTASVPDEPLMDAAARGELQDDATLLAQTDRLLGTARGSAAMEAFFAEMFELHELETVTKDPALYPGWSAALRAEMQDESTALFASVLEGAASIHELFVTQQTRLGPGLAEIYGLDPNETHLPNDSQRGGVLGRAAFLTVQSHNESTSPTYRGKFIASKLLCEDVPPPPAGVVFDLDPAAGGTTRDKLEQHAVDPACMGCHTLIDPPGFALEHFDPIGRWRDLDNGLPIDATGEIGGVWFDGAKGLGETIASDPRLPRCMVAQLLHFATARPSRPQDEPAIDRLTDIALGEDLVLTEIVRAIVRGDAFRALSSPANGVCEVEGDKRLCSTQCSTGVEICRDGAWQSCTATVAPLESCNGADDDCDGSIDEDLERVCTEGDGAVGGYGTERCSDGLWQDCLSPSERVEVCNGADDDGDGSIDEDHGIVTRTFALSQLSQLQPDCDLAVDPGDLSCLVGLQQLCEGEGCAVAGIGPVGSNTSEIDLACLSPDLVSVLPTNFEELHALYDGCGPDTFFSYCFPAAHALCAREGLTTGYGAIQGEDGSISVVCTPTASIFEISHETLSSFDIACDGHDFSAHTEIGCLQASAAFCQSQGFETGYGLLSDPHVSVVVACLQEPVSGGQ